MDWITTPKSRGNLSLSIIFAIILGFALSYHMSYRHIREEMLFHKGRSDKCPDGICHMRKRALND